MGSGLVWQQPTVAGFCLAGVQRDVLVFAHKQMQVKVLDKRSDFIKISKEGVSVYAPSFILLSKDNFDEGKIHVGYTITKKVGCAVERNRIRRRLKAAVSAELSKVGRPGTAYVFVANAKALSRPFPDLCQDLVSSVRRIHKSGARNE